MTRPLLRASALASSIAVVGALLLPGAAVAAVDTPAVIDPDVGTTQINLIGFNDFHGRILDAERFGATVVDVQNRFGAANSLILSQGDAVSASVFESAIALDEPTLDALNALGVQSYTVGNHEFDHGLSDATGRIQSRTDGPDLAANVTATDGSFPFEEYALFTVAGVTVGVIGAVTEETTALSAPGTVDAVTFGDPVEAVNRVAAQLSDGDPANGEADVIVASYHEGGPASDAPLADNTSSEIFRHIVEDTDPVVAAIYTAHTHRTYAYDAPNGASTRPVVQAGSYGGFVGQIVLTLDADGAVTASASSVIPTFAADAIPADIAADPRIVEIRGIVADAVAEADVLGSEKVGLQSGDFTRAKQYEPGSITVDPATGVTSGIEVVSDDRANASSLSDMVAQSMVDVVNARGNAHADLALMNPGGVRADIIDDDGVITYKEAATVVPFANDLNVVTLTTETLKATLEQQWQRTADGEVPSRPYLQLGLSDDFTYVYDSTRPEGDRILSLSLGDVPMAPGQEWDVAMSSFLAGGGDNFRALLDASANVGVGIIDTDAFPTWFRQISGDTGETIFVDARRNSIEVRGLGEPVVAPDGSRAFSLPCTGVELTVASFDLASLGYIQHRAVDAQLLTTPAEAGIIVGNAAVDPAQPNIATLAIEPLSGITGEAVLQLTAHQSAARTQIPVVVSCPAPSPSPTIAPTQPEESASPTPGVSPSAVAPSPTATAEGASLPATGVDGTSAWVLGGIALVIVIAGGALLIARRRKS